MGSTDYIEIPITDSVDFERGLVHRTKDASSPDSSGGGGGGAVGKLPKPEQTKGFARLMVSRSRREPPMKKSPSPIRRLQSHAELGLKGLRFLDNNSSKEGEGWKAVEKRFEQFAVAGKLHKENFGRCIGESLKYFNQKPFLSILVFIRICFNPRKVKEMKSRLIINSL